MYAQQRAHFEPLPLSTFVRCMGIYPPGTTVALSNGALKPEQLPEAALAYLNPRKRTTYYFDADGGAAPR